MGTEKDIIGKALHYGMRKENKPKYDLPKRDESPSLDYKNFGGDRQKEADFDRYVRKVYETEEALQRVDPYEKEPLKELTAKVNGFLRKHAGIDYQEFVRRANPYEFDENDYGAMPKKALRRRLFDHRAYLYLSALADSESEGVDIEQLLEQISSHKIPFIKKEEREPTFQAVYDILAPREKIYKREMANLFHYAYSGDLSLDDLRDKGLEVIERVMQEDPEGYDNDAYLSLKEAHRYLDNLHDDFTKQHFSENRDGLSKIEEMLRK